MATTPGKMNETKLDKDLTGTEGFTGTAGTEAGNADTGRNWNRETSAEEFSTSQSANVSNIAEGRGTREGWQQGASQLAGRAQEIASNVAGRAKEVATDMGGKARDFANNAADRTSSAIREYPMQSLLVGFGIGCLVGFLIPRR